MARVVTVYDGNSTPFSNNVSFIVKATGKKIVKSFEDEYEAYVFTNKLKYSRKCILVSHPLFS